MNKLSRMIAVACFGVLLLPPVSMWAEEVGEKKIANLRKLLKHGDAQVREKTAKDLAEFGPAAVSAVGDLVELLEKDKAPDVRIAAATGLGAIYFRGKADPPEKKAIIVLGRAVRHDDDTIVRWNACNALRNIGRGAKYAAPYLVEALKDKDDEYLRELGAISLMSLVGPDCREIVPALLEMHKKAKKEDSTVEAAILVSLGKIGHKEEEVLAILVDSVKNPRNSQSRYSAVNALGHLGAKAKPAVPLLIELLEDSRKLKRKDPGYMSYTVLKAFERIGPAAEDAVPLIFLIANDTDLDPLTRESARRALQATTK